MPAAGWRGERISGVAQPLILCNPALRHSLGGKPCRRLRQGTEPDNLDAERFVFKLNDAIGGIGHYSSRPVLNNTVLNENVLTGTCIIVLA
jgi:hypothetical protein